MDVLLHKAAVVSDVAIIRRLVAEGADKDAFAANGTRPLPLRHTMGTIVCGSGEDVGGGWGGHRGICL